MPTVFPYVPQRITVHLGAPSAYAANVTVPFGFSIKNKILIMAFRSVDQDSDLLRNFFYLP